MLYTVNKKEEGLTLPMTSTGGQFRRGCRRFESESPDHCRYDGIHKKRARLPSPNS